MAQGPWMTNDALIKMEALGVQADGTKVVHLAKGQEVRPAPTPPSKALAVGLDAPVPAFHIPEGVQWGTIVSTKEVTQGQETYSEVVCMHTDLELVLYNQLSQVAQEVFALQEAMDKAQSGDDINTEAAEAAQARHAEALAALQGRLDEALEARDLA